MDHGSEFLLSCFFAKPSHIPDKNSELHSLVSPAQTYIVFALRLSDSAGAPNTLSLIIPTSAYSHGPNVTRCTLPPDIGTAAALRLFLCGAGLKP